MSLAQELADLAYEAALHRVPLRGGVTGVERDGPDVLISGGKPHGLLGMLSAATTVRLTFSEVAVTATIVGGRKGIAVDKELFSRPVAGRSAQDVADEAVQAVSAYLAASTS